MLHSMRVKQARKIGAAKRAHLLWLRHPFRGKRPPRPEGNTERSYKSSLQLFDGLLLLPVTCYCMLTGNRGYKGKKGLAAEVAFLSVERHNHRKLGRLLPNFQEQILRPHVEEVGLSRAELAGQGNHECLVTENRFTL